MAGEEDLSRSGITGDSRFHCLQKRTTILEGTAKQDLAKVCRNLLVTA